MKRFFLLKHVISHTKEENVVQVHEIVDHLKISPKNVIVECSVLVE